MENKSLLNQKSIKITDQITLHIPTVGEILNEQSTYFSLVSIMTSTPLQYMVQLDDMHIDYTKISDFDMFRLFFPVYARQDISILFGDLALDDIYAGHDNSTNLEVL